MDLGINNVSFQGNLITRIKGNGNIVDSIRVEFAKLTKNTQGNLRMSHTWRHYNHESIDLSYRNVKMTTTGLDKFVTKDPKFLKPGELTNIANEFVGILKAFKIHRHKIIAPVYAADYNYRHIQGAGQPLKLYHIIINVFPYCAFLCAL